MNFHTPSSEDGADSTEGVVIAVAFIDWLCYVPAVPLAGRPQVECPPAGSCDSQVRAVPAAGGDLRSALLRDEEGLTLLDDTVSKLWSFDARLCPDLDLRECTPLLSVLNGRRIEAQHLCRFVERIAHCVHASPLVSMDSRADGRTARRFSVGSGVNQQAARCLGEHIAASRSMLAPLLIFDGVSPTMTATFTPG
eukprot:CAMPEP_0179137000 /NCGR_PEP_ID=MMETSP0796-20121207/65323_1 /TAXON_ID=73915 /ORGANISM="Pyrodinium bahamense, Strain pbaha01" /LENGTH=194 /DNA_ID=CAMNT_0020836135 /DNA_START=72 /DNA_END=653 /DNA_ORIENTATION=-